MELMALLEAEAKAKNSRSSRQREAVAISNPAIVASLASPQDAPAAQTSSQVASLSPPADAPTVQAPSQLQKANATPKPQPGETPLQGVERTSKAQQAEAVVQVSKAKSAKKKTTVAASQREKTSQRQRVASAAKPDAVRDDKLVKEDQFAAMLDAVAKSNALNADRARARSIRSLSTTSGFSSPSHITSPASVVEAETDAESRFVGSTTRSDNSCSIGARSGQSNCGSAEVCSESANEPGDWSSQSPSIGDVAECAEVAESIAGDSVLWAPNAEQIGDMVPDASKVESIENDCVSSTSTVYHEATRCAASKWLEDTLCGPSRRQSELQRLADVHQNYVARSTLPVPPPPPFPPGMTEEGKMKEKVGLADELRSMFPTAKIHIFPSAAQASPRSSPQPQAELPKVACGDSQPSTLLQGGRNCPRMALFQLPAASLGPPPADAPSVAEVEALSKASSWRDRLRKNGQQHLGEVEAALGRRRAPVASEMPLHERAELLGHGFSSFDTIPECTQVEAALGCHRASLEGADLAPPLSYGAMGPLDLQMQPTPQWHADSAGLYAAGGASLEVEASQLWQASPVDSRNELVSWQGFDHMPMDMQVPQLDGPMWHTESSLLGGTHAYPSEPHAFVEAMPMDSDQLVNQLHMGMPMDSIMERKSHMSTRLRAPVPAMENFDLEQIAAQLRAAAPCHYED
jgi:hypothetical protein